MLVRTFKYRLYPTKAQDVALRAMLEKLRELYNAALEERRDAWRKQRVCVSRQEQQRQLTAIRAEHEEWRALNAVVSRDPLRRVELAYDAFFRRLKAGKRAGLPRFKGPGRYGTIVAENHNGAGLISGGRRLRLSDVGQISVRLHRPIEGICKLVRVSLGADGKWHVCYVCTDVPARSLPEAGAEVGVDVGLSTFAALSDGGMVENPRHGQRAQRSIAHAQRRLCRRMKGSNRRRKARALLARTHAQVRRRRIDFHHKTAIDLVRRYGRIAVEDLSLEQMSRSAKGTTEAPGKNVRQKAGLNRSISDAGWGQFVSILVAKAESAGRLVVKVNPRGTSQMCSGCGAEVRKDLSVRVHACPTCGLVLDRDVNAARNILRLGRSLWGGGAVAPSVNHEAPSREPSRGKKDLRIPSTAKESN